MNSKYLGFAARVVCFSTDWGFLKADNWKINSLQLHFPQLIIQFFFYFKTLMFFCIFSICSHLLSEEGDWKRPLSPNIWQNYIFYFWYWISYTKLIQVYVDFMFNFQKRSSQKLQTVEIPQMHRLQHSQIYLYLYVLTQIDLFCLFFMVNSYRNYLIL